MRKCTYCDKEIPFHTEHLRYTNTCEDKLICSDCYEEETTTHFYICGEYSGSEDDGYTIVYGWEDEPNDKALEVQHE